MDKNFIIDQNMINYIFSHTNNLHKVQKKLLKYNEKLGHVKKLQISILQANFIQFIINLMELQEFTVSQRVFLSFQLDRHYKFFLEIFLFFHLDQ